MSSIRKNQPFGDYVNAHGVNQSSLKTLVMKSPYHYLEQITAPDEVESAAFAIGSLLHLTAFEPAELLRLYAVLPSFENTIVDDKGQPYAKPKATKAYKELVKKFEAEHADKTVIEASQFETVRQMYAALCQSGKARDFLREGDAEVGVFWMDDVTGIPCKARFDKWDQQRRLIVDLKTTRDVQNFPKAIANFGYDFQAAWYTWAAECITGEPHDFAIVAVEKDAPYCVRAALVGQDTIAAGRRKVRRALDTLAECQFSGDWPGYEDPDEWNLPAWALVDSEPATLVINGKEVLI